MPDKVTSMNEFRKKKGLKEYHPLILAEVDFTVLGDNPKPSPPATAVIHSLLPEDGQPTDGWDFVREPGMAFGPSEISRDTIPEGQEFIPAGTVRLDNLLDAFDAGRLISTDSIVNIAERMNKPLHEQLKNPALRLFCQYLLMHYKELISIADTAFTFQSLMKSVLSNGDCGVNIGINATSAGAAGFVSYNRIVEFMFYGVDTLTPDIEHNFGFVNHDGQKDKYPSGLIDGLIQFADLEEFCKNLGFEISVRLQITNNGEFYIAFPYYRDTYIKVYEKLIK